MTNSSSPATQARWALFLLCTALAAQTQPVYTAVVAGNGYQAPPPITIAPGQITTFFVGGLPQTSEGLAKLVAVIGTSGQTRQVQVLAAKRLNSETLAITVQMPFDLVPSTGLSNQWFNGPGTQILIQFAETANPAGDLCAEGSCSAPVSLQLTFALPHLLNTCDLFLSAGTTTGICGSAVMHQNGSLVTADLPAKPGEIVTAWAVGFGVPAGGIPAGATDPIEMSDIALGLFYLHSSPLSSGLPNPSYLWAGLPHPNVGIYQINFAVPQPSADVSACAGTQSGNLMMNVGRQVTTSTSTMTWSSEVFGFGGGSICVSSN